MVAGLSPRAVITHQTDEAVTASEPSSWTSLCRPDRSLSSTNRGSQAISRITGVNERGGPRHNQHLARYSGPLFFLGHGLW